MFVRKLALFALLGLAVACNKATDDSITTDIKAKMFSDPSLKSASVDVSTKDGVVTLKGQVPDDAARLAAQHIASSIPGVKTVVDQTTMAPPPPAPSMAQAAPEPPPAPARKRERSEKKREAAKAEPLPAPPPAAPEAPANPGPLASNASQTKELPSAPAPPPPPPPPQPITVTIPEGTVISVRTIDAIDSSQNTTGQTFRGSLDAPIVVDDKTVVPRGLNATLKLVEASSAGKFKGRSELTVSLDSFTFQGRTYQVASSDVQEKGSSRGKRSAAVIGGGAALGALIGGLAGGGKGAAIGAGVGAGGGTAVQALTHGQQVKIPSETKLDFTLHQSLPVTYLPKKTPQSRASSSDSLQQVAPSTPPPASSDQPPQPQQN